MKRDARSALLYWYPKAWRERYGEELGALVLDAAGGSRVPWRIRVDVIRGGCVERVRALRPSARQSREAEVRTGVSIVLWGWFLCVLGGGLLQTTSEHLQHGLRGQHGVATTAFGSMTVAAVVATVLVLAAIAVALPPTIDDLRSGGWHRVRRPFTIATVATIVFAAATAALVAWSGSVGSAGRDGASHSYAIGAVAWALLGAATLAAWTRVATACARGVSFSGWSMRVQACLAAGTAVCMVVIAAGAAAWWIAVGSASPGALVGAGGSDHSVLVPQLAVALTLMLAAVATGAAGLPRVAQAARR